MFEELEHSVFPRLLKSKTEDEPLRIWVAGCATGEEVYSIAITLFEALNVNSTNRNNTNRIQIFASDISENAIQKARTGKYSSGELQNLSEEQLRYYFTRTDGYYKIVKSIRDTLVFTVHNFLKDPPFRSIDLISCRNVFIYLDPFLQKKVLSTFHYALNENGMFLMGKSETTGKTTDLFTPIFKKAKIFSRKAGLGRFEPATIGAKKQPKKLLDQAPTTPSIGKTDFKKNAVSILISDYTPASIIVDEHYEIVYINGSIEPFVAPSKGRPTHELMKTARKELAFELRNALHKAKDSQEKIIKKGISVNTEFEQFSVDLEVVLLTDVVDPHYLILFWKSAANKSILKKVWNKIEPALTSSKDNQVQKRNTALEKELEQVREDMRSISVDQEACNEELQSSNEELLSSNEEMQSLNEELETSKEELQSTNEELIVVNRELIEKQDELNQALNYLDDVIATMREPFLVLDKNLRIQKVNRSYCTEFQCDKTEIKGKHFFEIKNKQWNSDHLRLY